MNSALPLQLTWNSVLCDDYFTSTDVLVDVSGDRSVVAPFRNASKQGVPEAFVISGGALQYLAHDPTERTGWKLTSIMQGVDEVAALVSPDGFVNVLYTIGSTLHQLYLDPSTGQWTDNGALGTVSGLRALKVTYTPSQKRPVLYGLCDAGVYMVAWCQHDPGQSAWAQYTADGIGSPRSIALYCNDETNWAAFADIETGPQLLVGGMPALGSAGTRWSVPITLGSGTIKAFLAAFDIGNHPSLLYVDGQGVINLAEMQPAKDGWSASTTTVSLSGYDAVAWSVAVDVASGALSVYFVDADNQLWVVHQGADPSGGPAFTTPTRIDAGIGAVFCDVCPAESTTLFSIANSPAQLAVNWQDANTTQWLKRPVQLATLEKCTAPRHRTELTLYDADGRVVAGAPLTITVSSVTELAVGNQYFLLDGAAKACVTTDACGRVTAAIVASDLSPPALTISGDDLPAVTIDPSAPIHAFIAGQGTLPTLPNQTWSGDLLTNATLADGTKLVADWQGVQPADMAHATQQMALAGAGQQTSDSGFSIGETGGILQLTRHSTQASLAAARSAMLGVGPTAGFGSRIARWFGDIWRGIKKAVCKVVGAVVSFADKTFDLLVQIGDEIVSIADVVIDDIASAFQAIGAFFAALIQDVERLITWLKALLDFDAIRNTAKALAQAISALPPFLSTQLHGAKSALASGSNRLQALCDDFCIISSKKPAFGSIQDAAGQAWPPPGQPAGNANTVKLPTTTVKGADIVASPHANWFQSQLSASDGPLDGIVKDLSTTLSNLASAVSGVATTFKEGLDDFKTSLLSAIGNDPKNLAQLTIGAFIELIEAIVQDAVTLCTAVVSSLIDLAQDLFIGLDALWQQPFGGPVLNTIYGWIAGSDEQMSMLDFMCMIVAFPVTVVYKLIAGVDQEPFPNGQWTQPGLSAAAATTNGLGLASGLAELVSVIPNLVLDLVDDAPLGFAIAGAAFWFATDALAWPESAVAGVTLGADAAMWFASTASTFLAAIPMFGAQLGLTQGAAQILANEFVPLLLSVGGVVEFVCAIVAAVEPGDDRLSKAANFFTPLPAVFAFLGIESIKDEVTIPLKVASDVLGYGVGGTLEVLDAVGV